MKPIERRLDSAWSLRVRSIRLCQRCGSRWNLEAHHIFGRRARSVRWDEENGVCLCRSCHDKQRRQPADFLRWAEEHLGVEAFDALSARARVIVKRTSGELAALLEELTG